jgi:hypothetical protein
MVLVFPLSVILSVSSIVRSSVHLPGNISLSVSVRSSVCVDFLLLSSVCRHIGRIVFPPSVILAVSTIFCSSMLLSSIQSVYLSIPVLRKAICRPFYVDLLRASIFCLLALLFIASTMNEYTYMLVITKSTCRYIFVQPCII